MLPAIVLALGLAPIPCHALQEPPSLGDETCESAFNLVVPADLVASQGGQGLTVVANYVDEDNLLRFDLRPTSAAVTVRRQGDEVIVARGRSRGRPADADIVLKRRPGRVAVACGTETVARAEAELPEGGRWGVQGAAAEALDGIWYQPIADVVFTDDFMRAPDEESPWEAVSGDWALESLRAAEFSANPFSFQGTGEARAPGLVVAGDWFWEDYTVEVSVRPTPGAEAFGLGLCYGPGPSFHLLRLVREEEDRGSLQLVRVRRGEAEVLAEADTTAGSGEWHRMAVSAVGDQLTGAIDGRELLSVPDPGLAHGQAALWVSGRTPVHFDDVTAYSGPRRARPPTVLAHAKGAADPAAQRFINDYYMEGWADESDRWQVAPGPSIWHSGYFWQDVEVTWEATPATVAAPTGLHICVPVDGPTPLPPQDLTAGYHLAIAPADGKRLSVTLSKATAARAEGICGPLDTAGTFALRRAGPRVEALLDGALVAQFEDDAPLTGGKIGFSGRLAPQQAPRLSIRSGNVIDSTFRSAPVEWRVGGGEWRVQSRWACTPRWSWFGGRAEHLAAIWTREGLAGDVILEFFGGFRMDSPFAPFYQNPSDINVTLCGDGANPGSGYSLIYGGWGNRKTAILRNGEVVAETEAFRLPDTLDSLGGSLFGPNAAVELHKVWRHIHAERVDGTVRLLIDGKPALSYDDPDPLPGGRAAIWTVGNGLTVARARIYHERTAPPPAPPPPARAALARPRAQLQVQQPPHIAETFEHGVKGWVPSEPGSCRPVLAERATDPADRCLLVTNPVAGGTFALSAPVRGVDVEAHPLLSFEYAIPPDVRVDAYVVIEGRKYRVRLTGPGERTPGIEDIGAVADVRADGRWRHAEVDLLGLLVPCFAPGARIVIDELRFASYAPPDYLMAGIGGNGARASYRLDNFFLGRAVAAPVRVRGQSDREPIVESIGVGAAADVARAREGPDWLVSPRRSGSVRVVRRSAQRVGEDLVAFDRDAPAARPAQPLPGEQWLGPRLTVHVGDEGPAGIAERSLAIEVAGRRFAWPAKEVYWEPTAGEFGLDVRAAGLEFMGGEKVGVRVGPVSDRAGNSAPTLEFDFTAALQADRSPPSPPKLMGVPAPHCRCDFEESRGCFRPWGVDSGADLHRSRMAQQAGGGAADDWSLEIRNTRLGGQFGVEAACVPFEASRCPVLSFDYRVPETLRVDLLVDVAGSRRQIKFTDNDATWPVIGRIEATADDRWHRAVVDLHGMLRQAFPQRRSLPVTHLGFASSGWPGNRSGTTYWLDGFEIGSVVDVPAAETTPELAAGDETGITAYSWLLDALPGTAPPHEAASGDLPTALAARPEQLAWLHASARDGAGNWSEAAHLPLWVARNSDTTPPSVSDLSPAPDESGCTRQIGATIQDEGMGVSPADIRLVVGEKTYTIAGESLGFDEASGRLTWTAPGSASLGDDGDAIACELEVTDLAGNGLPAPVSWTWHLDHSQDQEPPLPPVVSYWPSDTAAQNGFESGTGSWGNFVSCQVLPRAQGGATGPGCLELRDLRERGGTSFALIRDLPTDWRRFPIIRFRYCLDLAGPGAALALRATTFDGTDDLWTPLASFPAGTGWQTASVNMAEALRAADPKLTMHRIFLDCQVPDGDGAVLIDDFVLSSPTSTGARFAWAQPADASGIKGYSWLLDDRDDSVPDESMEGTEREARFTDLAPGHWCFHLRACDGAGNWGPPAHVPFDVVPPVPTP